jgi:hypothetical protein
MAFGNGPYIVTNGLVLALDAADRNSYVSGSTTWTDLSGNTNSGSLINGPTFNSGSGGNIVFDGTNDYVALGTFTGLGSTNRTINMWFRVTSLPASVGRIITFPADDTSTDTPTFTLAISSAGALSGGLGGSPYNGYSNSISYVLGTWVNICATISSNTVTFYKDTISQGSFTNTGTVATNPIGYLGRYNANYSQYFTGNIASTQIYNRALSATEILQNYNATKSRFNL